MEKQGVSLVFNLFSSLFTPEAISCGFLLLVCEENVFILVVCRVWLSASCVCLFLICFHCFNPLLAISCGFLLIVLRFEPGLEPGFKPGLPGFEPGFGT